MRRLLKQTSEVLLELIMLPLLLPVALVLRFKPKTFDIGLGPEPLINNVYHKRALQLNGYRVQTFVEDVYFITDRFDVRGDKRFKRPLVYYYLFFLSAARYRCIYIYFNGGALGCTRQLWRLEPFLYRLAGVKTVVLPYGGDVQDMTRSPNLIFKNAASRGYPAYFKHKRRRIERKIDLWTCRADHVVSGCEWVDYMFHWDTLMLAHFSIDTGQWRPLPSGAEASDEVKILHAPNHRVVKGTDHFVAAVDRLRQEGYPVVLDIVEQVPNDEIARRMAAADIIADQLIIGWYAMFALEAMAMGKPVLCYVREDLEKLYIEAGLIAPKELPLIKCSPFDVYDVIKKILDDRGQLAALGRQGRRFVKKHHSLEAVGNVFDSINRALQVAPSAVNPPE